MANYGPRELAKDLRDLLELNLSTKLDLDAWYESARETERRIRSSADLGDRLPEAIWHFLIDADIRLKDARYKTIQEEQLRAEIDRMEGDVWP